MLPKKHRKYFSKDLAHTEHQLKCHTLTVFVQIFQWKCHRILNESRAPSYYLTKPSANMQCCEVGDPWTLIWHMVQEATISKPICDLYILVKKLYQICSWSCRGHVRRSSRELKRRRSSRRMQVEMLFGTMIWYAYGWCMFSWRMGAFLVPMANLPTIATMRDLFPSYDFLSSVETCIMLLMRQERSWSISTCAPTDFKVGALPPWVAWNSRTFVALGILSLTFANQSLVIK